MRWLGLLATISAGLLLPSFALARADDFPEDLDRWIIIPTPGGPGIDEAWGVAQSDFHHDWVVSLRAGRPRVHLDDGKSTPSPLPFRIDPGSSRADGLSGSRFSSKVSDGWIVAFNAGEFGAGLWWFSPDGKKREKLAEVWISGFFPSDTGLLALEGLAHGGASKGRLIRIVQDRGGHWHTEDLVDLKHAPEASVKDVDGSLIVATPERLLRVFPASRKVDVLLDVAFWEGLYPNSIVIAPTGTIYLGMRHGVAKVEKKDGTYKPLWLVPNRAFADMKSTPGFK